MKKPNIQTLQDPAIIYSYEQENKKVLEMESNYFYLHYS